MFNCSCCGTEVTSPYFYDGGVYGWTCIKKLNPNAKRNKPKSKIFVVEIIKIKWRTPESNKDGVGSAVVLVNGNKLVVSTRKKISECGSYYLDEIDGIGNFSFYNGSYYAGM